MRMVVTGAKGFIGSVLCRRALELGHDVIAIDDGSRGLNPVEGLEFFPRPRPGQQFTFALHDCMGGIIEAVNRDSTVDAVIHLAAATGSLDRPLEELREFNVEMLAKVYLDARVLGARAFLWPCTSLALGVPDSPYVISKEEGLARLRTLDAEALTRIAVPVRFFNVAGAYRGFTERRKNEVHLLPEIASCIRDGRPLQINGDDYDTADGTPSRQFVNVVDVAEYLIDLARGRLAGWIQSPATDGAIWLGTGQSLTVQAVVDIAEQWTGKQLEVRVGPRRPYDCGALVCEPHQVSQFKRAQGGLIPARVSIRDEMAALLGEA